MPDPLHVLILTTIDKADLVRLTTCLRTLSSATPDVWLALLTEPLASQDLHAWLVDTGRPLQERWHVGPTVPLVEETDA